MKHRIMEGLVCTSGVLTCRELDGMSGRLLRARRALESLGQDSIVPFKVRVVMSDATAAVTNILVVGIASEAWSITGLLDYRRRPVLVVAAGGFQWL